MLQTGLRIFVGILVFIGIAFHPLPPWVPASNKSTDLWLHPRHAFIQRVSVNKTDLSKSAGESPPVFRPAEETTGNTSPAAATAETIDTIGPKTSSVDAPGERNPQITAGQRKEILPAEIPPVFYRLDVPDKVAITFDDGPCPGMTERYLEILQDYDIQSTFFVIGQQVNLYPETAMEIIANGSEIGSHSWQHDPLDRLKPEQISTDLEKTAMQIYASLEQEILFLRPPYGRGSKKVLKVAEELGQKIVYWDVDPRDWENPSPEKIIKTVMEQVKPGSIILLHEGRRNTLAALPGIIEALQARDLQPVSVSGLLSATVLE